MRMQVENTRKNKFVLKWDGNLPTKFTMNSIYIRFIDGIGQIIRSENSEHAKVERFFFCLYRTGSTVNNTVNVYRSKLVLLFDWLIHVNLCWFIKIFADHQYLAQKYCLCFQWYCFDQIHLIRTTRTPNKISINLLSTLTIFICIRFAF